MIAAAPYLIWGVVLHLIADWPLQNEWMAQQKAKRRERLVLRQMPAGEVASGLSAPGGMVSTYAHVDGPWWDRHPAAYVHAGIHGAIQLLVFPWWAALFIAVTHLVIDTRKPVEWWSKKIGQTQPEPNDVIEVTLMGPASKCVLPFNNRTFDVGTEVRFWTDQVFHIAVVAIAALAVVA